jgi:DNA-binding XRE family transcriptional regulator
MGRRPASEPPLTIGIIEELKNKGYTQSEIAEMFDVSKQAVSWHKQTYNGSVTPREEVNRHFPWQVPHQMNQCAPYRRMRDHGEYMATGGKGMSQDKLQRLRSFYKKLRDNNLVLEFDPTLPPEPGVASQGGFAFKKRLKSDNDLLIRKNSYTTLSEEGKMIWRFPPEDP